MDREQRDKWEQTLEALVEQDADDLCRTTMVAIVLLAGKRNMNVRDCARMLYETAPDRNPAELIRFINASMN